MWTFWKKSHARPERWTSNWSGASPGHPVLLVFVSLQTPRSPRPPRGCHLSLLAVTAPTCGLLPLCMCPPFLSFLGRTVACSEIPMLAWWGDSGSPWNPLHWNSFPQAPCAVSPSPLDTAVLDSHDVGYCFLSLSLSLTAELHFRCIWSFLTSFLLQLPFRIHLQLTR